MKKIWRTHHENENPKNRLVAVALGFGGLWRRWFELGRSFFGSKLQPSPLFFQCRPLFFQCRPLFLEPAVFLLKLFLEFERILV